MNHINYGKQRALEGARVIDHSKVGDSEKKTELHTRTIIDERMEASAFVTQGGYRLQLPGRKASKLTLYALAIAPSGVGKSQTEALRFNVLN